MLNFLRRIGALLAGSSPRDERRDETPHGPLVALVESDLANLDNLTRSLPAPRRS
jgi:hypothetical protein